MPAERGFISDMYRDGVDGAVLQDVILVDKHGHENFVVWVVVAFDDHPGDCKGPP